ncbi:sulfite exporter TauE/SafE family protein [Acetobacterium wieringae]|uniref:sulfite exporter TauE/SafE family protein n=1 Tax=Acetobacterium wieringae TaxID=52694 RepID=UPI0020337561|nr:sulfite exporter TauE/SafE family protein [Acetobacterium wieringae]MEA4807225.1 sulfite exporter TauE/SafE family protein [Acetobacterium wieringae]URN84170.1 sulfite exporter TauE/SafE family protein [Acetobacterium wieringae]
MEIFPDLELVQWLWVILAALLIGVSKTGISGLLTLVIPILAAVFGGKASTGIILPMLIVGDVFALFYYKHNAKREDILKLLPWTFMGLIFGLIIGGYINDEQFKSLIALSVLLCLFLLIYFEKKGDQLKIPDKTWLHASVGILAGFTSMIGNAAGPIFSVYLLAKGVDKVNFLGMTAWFFFIVNVTKLPMQVFIWHNITVQTFVLTGLMIPFIGIGAVFGAFIIKRINEKAFRYLIIGMTAIVALKLFF